MGTHKGALVALDAFLSVPVGDTDGNAALLIGGRTGGIRAVLHRQQAADRDIVALHAVYRLQEVPDVGRHLSVLGSGCVLGAAPRGRDRHLVETGDALIHGITIHGHHIVALLAIGHGDGVLQIFYGVLDGDDIRQLEECRLHDHVGAVAQAQIPGNVHGVDGVEPDMVLRQIALHGGGKVFLQRGVIPHGVQQEDAAVFQTSQNIILADIGLLRAGDEVRLVDQIGGADGRIAKAQMGHGDAAGLFGVVGKIGLRVLIGVVADDLHSALVGAHSAVRAQTPELAGGGARVVDGQILHGRQIAVIHIVNNAHGEVILGGIRLHILKHLIDVVGPDILAAYADTAAHHHRLVLPAIERGLDVHIQRLALSVDLFYTIQRGDDLHGLGNVLKEVLQREGTIQMHRQQTHLLAQGIQGIYHFFDGLAHGADGHDHALGIRRTIVVEQVIVTAGELVDLAHVVLHHVRQLIPVAVDDLALLEMDVRILHGAANTGMIRVHGAAAEGIDGVLVHQLGQFVILQHLDLLDLMTGAETVKEVQERHAALDGAQVGHGGQIGGLLDAAAAQQGKARLAAVHHVAVVAENAQTVGGHQTGSHVEHAGQQFACDLEHIGDHQHQALRGGIGAGQSACLQRAVNRA